MNYILTEVKADSCGKITGIKINNQDVNLHAPLYDGKFELLSVKKNVAQVICPAELEGETIIAVISDKSVTCEAVKISKGICSVKGKGKINFYNDFAKIEDGKLSDMKAYPLHLGAIEV